MLAVLVAAFLVVFSQIPPDQLFNPGRGETTIDIGGLELLVWGVVIGAAAVALAGTLAFFATRRAVAPLVDALGRQRRFVADASHELRTPLAILDARLQVLDRSLGPDDPHQEIVAELRGDSQSLIAVVSDLLDAVDVAPAGDIAPVAVGAVARSAVDDMRMLARERAIEIRADSLDPELRVAIPETSLHRSLVALLDNAVKHSPAGSVVTLSTEVSRMDVILSIADQGPGIRGIDPTRVFDRFARSSEAVDGGGTARTGFGIGLSLVQETVSRYRGRVEVARTSAEGTTIFMRLPLARS